MLKLMRGLENLGWPSDLSERSEHELKERSFMPRSSDLRAGDVPVALPVCAGQGPRHLDEE